MFRDGRSFDADATIAETLPFPRPSTLAGALRTAWAESRDNFNYDEQGKTTLLNKKVQGPLLTEINDNEVKVLFPAPADSLCLADDQGDKSIYRLKPSELDNDKEGTDLPNDKLMPVFLRGGDNRKPAKGAPAFWYLDKFIAWLADDNTSNLSSTEQQGITPLPVEVRTHVAIDPASFTNKVSHLFQTAGVDFSERQLRNADTQSKNRGWEQRHYGLLMRFSDDIPDGFRTFGGEARMGEISKLEKCWPECPKPLADKLNMTKTFRLHLITPAIFINGYLPAFIDEDSLQGKLGDLEVTLYAAAVPRWQAGTSWDMVNGKTGKGMRTVQRLVPAGAVYWFEINKGDAKQLAEYWLTSISDERKNDGYGLVVPGIWTK